jgi:hypothetical protein
MYSVLPTHWVVEVNGTAVKTLDDFISCVRGLKNNEYVRLKVISFDLIPSIISVKTNLTYWPSLEVDFVSYALAF